MGNSANYLYRNSGGRIDEEQSQGYYRTSLASQEVGIMGSGIGEKWTMGDIHEVSEESPLLPYERERSGVLRSIEGERSGQEHGQGDRPDYDSRGYGVDGAGAARTRMSSMSSRGRVDITPLKISYASESPDDMEDRRARYMIRTKYGNSYAYSHDDADE